MSIFPYGTQAAAALGLALALAALGVVEGCPELRTPQGADGATAAVVRMDETPSEPEPAW